MSVFEGTGDVICVRNCANDFVLFDVDWSFLHVWCI